jgi:peptidoglycan/xylan/chitin deacetylase (PgdA/CDA1 family)
VPPARFSFYVLNVAAIGLALRSLVAGPPPWPWALFASFLYVACFMCGVLFLRLRIFVDAVVRGPAGAQGVALTFDDGPDPASTPQVLAQLAKARAKAAFFVVGHKAEAHPELVSAIVAAGHALGVHGYQHDRLCALRSARTVRADLQRAIAVIETITGRRPRLYRAPVGHVSPPMASVVRELGLDIIGWSVKSLDGWPGAKPSWVLARVIPRLDDRTIVLLHDASERGDFVPASLQALPEILAVAAQRRLELVRVDDWLGHEPRA